MQRTPPRKGNWYRYAIEINHKVPKSLKGVTELLFSGNNICKGLSGPRDRDQYQVLEKRSPREIKT